MGKCSCAHFHSMHICEHIMAVGYLYDQLNVDAHAKDAVPVGKKPTRGRKPKVGPALSKH